MSTVKFMNYAGFDCGGTKISMCLSLSSQPLSGGAGSAAASGAASGSADVAFARALRADISSAVRLSGNVASAGGAAVAHRCAGLIRDAFIGAPEVPSSAMSHDAAGAVADNLRPSAGEASSAAFDHEARSIRASLASAGTFRIYAALAGYSDRPSVGEFIATLSGILPPGSAVEAVPDYEVLFLVPYGTDLSCPANSSAAVSACCDAPRGSSAEPANEGLSSDPLSSSANAGAASRELQSCTGPREPRPPAIVAIAGTGSVVIGRPDAASPTGEVRAFGRGPLSSDPGSGFDMGLRFARRFMQEHDTGTAAPELYEHLKAFAIDGCDGVAALCSSKTGFQGRVASLAPVLLAFAEKYDNTPYFEDVMAAASALAQGIRSVARRIGPAGPADGGAAPSPDLVLSGGLFQNSEFYRNMVLMYIKNFMPKNTPRHSLAPPDVAPLCLRAAVAGCGDIA